MIVEVVVVIVVDAAARTEDVVVLNLALTYEALGGSDSVSRNQRRRCHGEESF